MTRAISHEHAGRTTGAPTDTVRLTHDERHIRRRLLALDSGDRILVDLPAAVALEHGDVLVCEDGRRIAIAAAEEALYAVTGTDGAHIARLSWHIGNRHLPAQIERNRILIERDHVIRDMLTGLGATVNEVSEPFAPERGAYHGHGEHGHGHDHSHHHG